MTPTNCNNMSMAPAAVRWLNHLSLSPMLANPTCSTSSLPYYAYPTPYPSSVMAFSPRSLEEFEASMRFLSLYELAELSYQLPLVNGTDEIQVVRTALFNTLFRFIRFQSENKEWKRRSDYYQSRKRLFEEAMSDQQTMSHHEFNGHRPAVTAASGDSSGSRGIDPSEEIHWSACPMVMEDLSALEEHLPYGNRAVTTPVPSHMLGDVTSSNLVPTSQPNSTAAATSSYPPYAMQTAVDSDNDNVVRPRTPTNPSSMMLSPDMVTSSPLSTMAPYSCGYPWMPTQAMYSMSPVIAYDYSYDFPYEPANALQQTVGDSQSLLRIMKRFGSHLGEHRDFQYANGTVTTLQYIEAFSRCNSNYPFEQCKALLQQT